MALPIQSSVKPTEAQRFLDPKVLARLSNLQLVAKTVVEGFLIGLHRSPFYGVSIDFAEYRPYSPGDDPRAIDWNVYARTDRYYLKKYHGETNAVGLLLFDTEISDSIRARARRGQLSRILHALDRARPGKATDFSVSLG